MEKININDTFTVSVTDYSSDGAGLARLGNGCAVFVNGGVRGDVCRIIITKVLPRICRADITEIITPSVHRIAPDCPAFSRCGGCDWRHISYNEELYAKRKKVNDALKRIAGLDIEAEDILYTGKINGYRNNVQLKTNGKKTGFYAKASHDIAEIDQCLLVPDAFNEAIRRGETRIRTATETLGDLTFRISPESFFQVNTDATVLLYDKAREYAALEPHELLLDLYCGTGSTTLYIGRDAERAIGVELNASAVADARENAVLNGINNVEFICMDVSELNISGLKPGCLIVDPPRKGLTSEAVRLIGESGVNKIIYISCNPATLARDIKLLTNYSVVRVCAVDMFPRTKHVECVAMLERITKTFNK